MVRRLRNAVFVTLVLLVSLTAYEGKLRAWPMFDCYFEDDYWDSASLGLCGFFESGTACDTLTSECNSYCVSGASGNYWSQGLLYYCNDYSGGNYADAGCQCY
jgi:hypothetical protein